MNKFTCFHFSFFFFLLLLNRLTQRVKFFLLFCIVDVDVFEWNRSLPEIDGLSKETVLTSWMAKFDCILKGTGDEDSKRPSRMQQPLNSELILSKDQLYDMFQQILGVKKFEHQILFNALMVSEIVFILFNNSSF